MHFGTLNHSGCGRFVAIVCFLLLGGVGAAQADVFTVARVPVDATAADAATARFEALRQGRRSAVTMLLRRLTLEQDWQYLPGYGENASDGAPGDLTDPALDPNVDPAIARGSAELGLSDAPAAEQYMPEYLADLTLEALAADAPLEDAPRLNISLTDEQIEGLISGLEVANAKNSATRYIGEITYTFKPEAVRELLKSAQIPYSEVQARPVLVLPILETVGRLYFWEAENPWARAWRTQSFSNELTPFVLALGDLQDISGLPPESALALNENGLAGLASRYGVAQIYLAHAAFSQSNGEDRLHVRLVKAYDPLAEDEAEIDPYAWEEPAYEEPEPVFSAEALSEAPLEAPLAEETAPLTSFDPALVLAEGVFTRPSGQFAELAKDGIVDVSNTLAEKWKERTLIDHSSAQKVAATAHFRSMGEWLEIRRALTSAPTVEGVQVAALSPDGAFMTLTFVGSPEQLEVALGESEFSIWVDEQTQVWNIASRDLGDELRGWGDPYYDPVRDGRESFRTNSGY